MTKVKDLNDLKRRAKHGVEVVLMLAGGSLRSTKYITYDEGKWLIDNYIDGSTSRSLGNIEVALKRGALYFDE